MVGVIYPIVLNGGRPLRRRLIDLFVLRRPRGIVIVITRV